MRGHVSGFAPAQPRWQRWDLVAQPSPPVGPWFGKRHGQGLSAHASSQIPGPPCLWQAALPHRVQVCQHAPAPQPTALRPDAGGPLIPRDYRLLRLNCAQKPSLHWRLISVCPYIIWQIVFLCCSAPGVFVCLHTNGRWQWKDRTPACTGPSVMCLQPTGLKNNNILLLVCNS